MQIRIWRDWLVSINLYRGAYSSVLNPHVLLVNRHKKAFGVRFPNHWRVWSFDWDWRAYRRRRKDRLAAKAERYTDIPHWGVRKIYRIGLWPWHPLSLHIMRDGMLTLYARVPFYWTWAWSWRDPMRTSKNVKMK